MMPLELATRMDKTVDLACFKDLLLQTCGHSFEGDRELALVDALGRRLSALNIQLHDAYYARLLHDRDELLRLTELLTVNETYFFREPEHLNLIVNMLPEFMADRGQRPIRILSAGCSTGEEPYSIAMLLRERFGTNSEQLFAITGVDIDSTVIASARRGIYGESSFRGINNALRERYFQPFGPGKFKISETICRQVEFEVVNLLGPAYTQRMQSPHIILYRNVSIYFPGDMQRQIFHRLADLLVEGGCLLVGAAETIHHDLSILSLVRHESLFFFRKIPHAGFQTRGTPRDLLSVPERERRTDPMTAVSYAANSQGSQVLRKEGSRQNRPSNLASSGASREVRERYETANNLARNHRADESLTLLDAIIAQDASFTKAYILKANLLLIASRFDEVVDICHSAIDQDMLCPEIHLMLGMVTRQQGDDDDALKRFQEALYLDVSCWLAHFFSAEIHYGRGDEKRARNGYEAADRILNKADSGDPGHDVFPLTFNVDQFVVICQHKLSLLNRKRLKKNGL